MENNLKILAVIGIFLLGFLTSAVIFNKEPPVSPALIEPQTSSTLIASSSPPPDQITVKRVIDGDTIELSNGEKVRYVGIDTPESVDPRKPVQCFGVEASKRNKELVEGKAVRLEKDISDRDRYGRLLRFVYIDNVFINLELVKQGYAHAYDYPPDISKAELFRQAEAEARTAGRGLWSGCPTLSGETAKSAEAVLPLAIPDSACTIKGNISSSGEKIYHLLGCGSYTKTSIDTARGERWFCSEQEAHDAGWRKAGNC